MTPAVRQLERAGVAHRVLTYQHGTGVASYGTEAVEKLGLDAAAVLKTLLVQPSEGRPVVALVPVTAHLDVKAAARAVGAKRATMAEPAVAERITGYVVGGISPFGQRTRLATFVDDSAAALDLVYVSGGRRGVELEIEPSALVALLGARFVPLQAP